MSGSNISPTIAGVDKASAILERVNRRVNQLAPQSDRERKLAADRAREEAKAQKEQEAGIRSQSKAFSDLSQNAFAAFENVSRLVPPLATITSVATVAGLARAMQSFGQAGQEIGNTARRSGTAVDQLDALQGAMRLAGGSADAAVTGVTSFRDTLTDAIGGANPQALQYLNQFGIQFRGVGLTARNVTEVLPQALEALRNIQDPSLKARVAQSWFGGAAEDFVRLSQTGARTYAELTAAARHYGLWTEQSAAAATRFAKSETEAELAVKGLGIAIATDLEPVFTPVLHGFAEFIAANRHLAEFGAVGAIGLVGYGFYRTTALILGAARAMRSFGTVIGATVAEADAAIAPSLLWRFLSAAWLPGLLRALGPIGAVMAAMWPTPLNGAPGSERQELDRMFPGRPGGSAPVPGAAPGGSPPGGTPNRANLGGPELAAQQRAAMTMLVQSGMDPARAAGMVAAFSRESTLNPDSLTLDRDNLWHRGLASWSPERQRLFRQALGHDMDGDLAEQLYFAQWEMQHSPAEALANREWQAARTPSEASQAMIDYLRPYDRQGAYRQDSALAERLYRQYNPGAPAAPPTAPAPPAPGAPTTVPAPAMGPPANPTQVATPDGTPAPAGRVQLDLTINHNGIPPGTTTDIRARSDSDMVDLRPPLVVRTMPGR